MPFFYDSAAVCFFAPRVAVAQWMRAEQEGLWPVLPPPLAPLLLGLAPAPRLVQCPPLFLCLVAGLFARRTIRRWLSVRQHQGMQSRVASGALEKCYQE